MKHYKTLSDFFQLIYARSFKGMNKAVKIAAASLLAVLIHSQANAVTLTTSGTFNLNPPGNNDCNGCSGNNTNHLDMSGDNNSSLTANSKTTTVTAPTNDVVIGSLTWVNRASTVSGVPRSPS
jgi:hypothetical protein